MTDQTFSNKRNSAVLADDLQLGAVELFVRDLPRMKGFYASVIGLDIIAEDAVSATLGDAGRAIITLRHRVDLAHAERSHAGLYHVAILFSSQSELARTVFRVIKHMPHLYAGSADHLVSEAFYLADPEGNGIELYYDRDATTWEWEQDSIKMATLYLDPQDYLVKHMDSPADTSVKQTGHVHLKVGDIAEARRFYADILGFNVTADVPGALFISVGGYHHHFGLNIWESSGAGRRPAALGLASVEVIVPTRRDVDRLKDRLTGHHIPFDTIKDALKFDDPWGNAVIVHS